MQLNSVTSYISKKRLRGLDDHLDHLSDKSKFYIYVYAYYLNDS